MKEPTFEWNPETGVALCALTDNGKTYIGIAQCSPADRDMLSEKTGCNIALLRAQINYYKHIRDNEIKPGLNALKSFYYSINRSKYYNQKNYENKMLFKQIQNKEYDLIIINKMLTDKKAELKSMIEEKEKFYQKIRRSRNKDKKE